MPYLHFFKILAHSTAADNNIIINCKKITVACAQEAKLSEQKNCSSKSEWIQSDMEDYMLDRIYFVAPIANNSQKA